ncbi:sensor protein DltS [Thermoclostridium stercorarium subsp. stercorarium DSM 8532]|uniref:histidine kinase n=2 Tax=Thermoclostridium stercorarium TaxID=1510 RepID=L7VKT4_THES1|nr:HAMP domain-containing sensor histidine kinase [Thermoclostridium stercorarium]AGC68740.1 sensor protein DltS [Thermoclostridium stercorarium subsp. stercorarium DSM 8532]AGI39748.1 histidine kinase [Thermoclostridium stercorarium subsp. stercorarium DSM 8532]ANW99071.1 two-component sensor histidine kinase [Thermoclostridium stercorarium subsp. thermolacticum DSM 2910]
MIKKLQRKFIIVSMAVFIAVLTIIITGINVANYMKVVHEADELLEILSKNKGVFPIGPGGRGQLPPRMSPEVPYETRFFSVVINQETNRIVQVETGKIVSVNRDDAITFARQILKNNREKGFIKAFRFRLQKEGSNVRVIFLDCGRRLDAFRSFLFASIAICFISLILVFALIVFFSNKVIRPISESYEKQKRFITDAGHELKTPLTVINADLDVLEMELGENEWLDDIKKHVKRLAELTNDLIFLARMEESENKLQMVEFPFSDVVSETASSFQALAQAQNKEFECKIQPMVSLKGNEKSIRHLVEILLDNALKYSPEKGRISLNVHKHPGAVVLSVYNTTENLIPKESLSRIFERFYRLDPSRNSQTGGHGIGLSIAQAIVSAHNGRIHCTTDDGHSLLVTVTLPA